MVNNELKLNYKKIFKFLDCKIFLKVPSFKYVLKWRMLQKKIKFKIKKKTNGQKANKKIYNVIRKNYKTNDC